MDSPACVVKAEIRGQRSEDSWQQAGFRIVDFEMFDDSYDFYDFYDFYGFYDSPFTVYRLPFTISLIN